MMVTHLDPRETILSIGSTLQVSDLVATIGTSDNSSGNHAYVEVAVNESGLRSISGQLIPAFWGTSVVERSGLGDPGLRFDPLPLFDMLFDNVFCPGRPE